MILITVAITFAVEVGNWAHDMETALTALILHYLPYTVELPWLQHLWNHDIVFEIGLV